MLRDESYLLDILIAAKDARDLSAGLSWDEFKTSRLHQLAISKVFEMIGEAAGKISSETRAAHPEIPWNEIVGMRNRLVHDYLRVDLLKVWDTVQNDITPLIDSIEPLVPKDNP
jgi:uncharacterized protein with HEPN domain